MSLPIPSFFLSIMVLHYNLLFDCFTNLYRNLLCYCHAFIWCVFVSLCVLHINYYSYSFHRRSNSDCYPRDEDHMLISQYSNHLHGGRRVCYLKLFLCFYLEDFSSFYQKYKSIIKNQTLNLLLTYCVKNEIFT